MKVITFLNEKGGVGKTTLSTHVAAGLADMGYRVLLVDMDPQAHSTLSLLGQEHGGLYRTLVQGEKWAGNLARPDREMWADGEPEGDLLVLPGNHETRAIPLLTDDALALRHRLEDIADSLDVVVIDTSPQISMLHTLAYAATDYILYPTECEQLSLDGLGKSVMHISRLNETRKQAGFGPAKLLGVVPMKVDLRTDAHRHGLDQITSHFGKLTWQAISVRTVYREASYAGKTLFAYAPRSDAAEEMRALISRVEKGIRNGG